MVERVWRKFFYTVSRNQLVQPLWRTVPLKKLNRTYHMFEQPTSGACNQEKRNLKRDPCTSLGGEGGKETRGRTFHGVNRRAASQHVWEWLQELEGGGEQDGGRVGGRGVHLSHGNIKVTPSDSRRCMQNTSWEHTGGPEQRKSI